MFTRVSSSLISTVSASQIVAVGASNGKVLTHDGTTWVAGNVPVPSGVVKVSDLINDLNRPGWQAITSVNFIMQWGLAAHGTSTTFPISFGTVFGIVLGKTLGGDGVPRVSSVTNTSFYLDNAQVAAGSAYWFAYGSIS